MKSMKKILSFILAFVMVCSLLPAVPALAADTEQLVLEGENMTKVSGPGKVQNMSGTFAYAGFSGGYQYWSTTETEEGYAMELAFVLSEDFKGSMDIAYCTAADFGIFDIYVDDVKLLDDLDMYYEAGVVGKGVQRAISDLTDEIELEAGTHTLKIHHVGQNANSTGRVGSVDCLILDGVFTEQVDWSQVTDVIEAEEMGVVKGAVYAQAMPSEFPNVFAFGDYSADRAIWFSDNKANAAMELSFETNYAYHGDVEMGITVASDYGIFDVYLDNVLVYDDLDTYAAALGRRTVTLPDVTLQPGSHILKMVNVGKNAASKGYYAGVDCLKFDTYVAYRPKTIVLEGELMETVSGKRGNQTKNSWTNFSARSHMWTTAAVGDGDVFELAFELDYAYEGVASIAHCKAGDFGIFDIYVDDVLLLEDEDMYNSTLTNSGLVEMGEVSLTAGRHILKLVNKGKNTASTGYIGSVDCLVLSPKGYTYSYVDAVNMIDDLKSVALLPQVGEKGAAATSYHRVSKYDEKTDTYIEWGDREPGATQQGSPWTNNRDKDGCIGPADDGKGGIIAADIQGAGMIVRSWFATPQSGLIEIYIDGAEEPAISMPAIDFVTAAGRYEDLDNLVYITDARGYNNYTPITFSKSCKIILREGWGSYYHFSYRLFADGETVEPIGQTFTKEQKDALLALNARLGDCAAEPAAEEGQSVYTENVTLPVGETTTIFEATGEAAITQFKVTINDDLDWFENMRAMQMLEISMFWDGKTQPAVWAPFGDFFANSGGQEYASVPMGMVDGTFYSYWYMPYADGAKIVIENMDEIEHNITVEVVTAPVDGDINDYGRFHAKWSQNEEAGRGTDYTLLRTTQGRGRFVGTNLHILNITPTWWWGEGDEKFFVDGEKFPSTYGTGSEDYFGYAWCDASYFNEALHAQNWTPGTIIGERGDYNNVRFHIADNIPFQTSFEGALEKFHYDYITQYSFTSYWYLDADGVDPYEPVKYTGEEADYRYLSLQIAQEEVERRKNTNVLEGEWMEIVSTVNCGKPGVQNMDEEWPNAGQFSNGRQVWSGLPVTGPKEMVLEFSLDEDFEGVLQAAFCTASDYGILQLYLDEQALGGPIDCYNTSVRHSGLKNMGEVSLAAGKHTLKIVVNEKNAASKGYLFGLDCLVLGEHILTRQEASEATCVEKGYPEHWLCSDCGKLFKDKYGTQELLETELDPVDPDNHVGGTELVGVVEMTHYTDGYTGDTICSSCKEVLVPGTVIEAEHFANGTATVVPPTCTTDGYTIYTCDDCDIATYGDVVPAQGHDYDEVVTPPTHTCMGFTTHTCETCGHTYIDTYTDALGHDYKQEVTVEPTCTSEGEMTFTCDCGESYTMPLPKSDHDYVDVVTPPTCTTMGYTTHTCDCGHSYADTYTDALGHDYQEEITTEPSCTAEGVKTFTCECGESYTEILPKIDHVYTSVVVDPTETEFGYTEHTCSGCGHSYITDIKQPVNPSPSLPVTPPVVVGPTVPVGPGVIGQCDGGAGCPAHYLIDVDPGSWYHESVDYVVRKGIMIGVSENSFAPNATMTRASVWTVLARLSGKNVDGGSIWYAKAQEWSVQTAVSDGTNPNGSISREQLVTMLYRSVGSPTVAGSYLIGFSDSGKVSAWAYDAMNWAVATGIIRGNGVGLNPQGTATRAEVAQIFMNYDKYC